MNDRVIAGFAKSIICRISVSAEPGRLALNQGHITHYKSHYIYVVFIN